MPFQMPPERRTTAGRPRHVGFEFEFAGIEPGAVCDMLVQRYGGTHRSTNRFAHEVAGTVLGTFRVELDAVPLKNGSYARYLSALGVDVEHPSARRRIDNLLDGIATPLVPYELVTPPLALTELDRIETLRSALRTRRAAGTGESLVYAFGLHINPEAPALTTESILHHLRAFLLLHRWLRRKTRLDLTRWATMWVTDFPEEYYQLVLDEAYHPDAPRFIDDYLRYNPTRNRALDILPLLGCLDREKVQAAVDRPELVQPRPTYHYRLPNCRVSDPSWRIADEWNRWVQVERLADDPDRLARVTEAFLRRLSLPLGNWLDRWAVEVEQWLVPDAP